MPIGRNAEPWVGLPGQRRFDQSERTEDVTDHQHKMHHGKPWVEETTNFLGEIIRGLIHRAI